jgi:NNP family nitrate/nitrite transporter-like MFS transporter
LEAINTQCQHVACVTFFLLQVPIIRENLGADKWEMGNAGVAAVIGAIFCRMGMGVILDSWGPRYGTAMAVLVS